MTRNTLISLVALAGIVLYFALQPSRPAATPVQEEPYGAPRPAAPAVQGEQNPSGSPEVRIEPLGEAAGCGARITSLGRSGAEVVLSYEGEASRLWAKWPGGAYQARVEDACSGLTCRLVLPRPGMGEVQVGLDACPGVEVP